jgi:AraC-like DNA-binding protein
MLERAGIAASLLEVERARVSTEQFAQLVQELWLVLDDEFIGMGPARSKVGTFAIMCHATVHCSRDLRSALRRASEFYALFPAGPEFRLSEPESTAGSAADAAVEAANSAVEATGSVNAAADPVGEARIEFGASLTSDDGTDRDPDHFQAETLLVVAHRFAGWLIRRRIPLLRVELAYAAPPHVLEYDLLFGAPCRFGAETTALVFDSALLKEPLLQDEAGIAAFLRRAPQDLLARIDDGSTTAARVRRLLGQSFPGPGLLPTESELADRLSVSPQTLRRRLAAEGTSFQQIRDQMRRDHAIAALAEGRTPIERISEQLGFSEPSAFHRAFKRWTGSTPRAYHPGESDESDGGVERLARTRQVSD